jgi:hypothetical protein
MNRRVPSGNAGGRLTIRSCGFHKEVVQASWFYLSWFNQLQLAVQQNKQRRIGRVPKSMPKEWHSADSWGTWQYIRSADG